MASLPSQPSRRRSPVTGQESSPSEQQSSTTMPPTIEEISEPHMLNDSASTDIPSHTTSQQPSKSTGKEVRRCWICQEDDTDDTTEDSVWRTPCPCSLTAHEVCLLQWIATEEAPAPGSGLIAATKQIVCPQCKAEIKVERPTDPVVMAADVVQRVAKTLVLPTAVSTVVGFTFSGLLVYGLNTLHTVFGPEEAAIILLPSAADLQRRRWLYEHAVTRVILQVTKGMDFFIPGADLLPNWKLFLGLPLIAPALVLSRTRLADHAFAIVPITYFLFRPEGADVRQWPPSPALTISVLPYLRTAYNELYRHTFADLEKEWDQAVQRKPREGETEEDIAAAAQDEEGGRAVLDFELQFVEEPEEPPPEVPRPIANAPAEEGNADGAAVLVDDNEQPAEPPAEQPAGRRRGDGNWEMRHNVSSSHVITTVIGALFFPTISSLMGDVLGYTLPRSWITKHGEVSGMRFGIRAGFLQQKWGRTIAGGCLFVVLKDVVTLYCKWRKAKDFGKRRVLDYGGDRKASS